MANPSGSRTPSTGGWGASEARRELAQATEPSRSRLGTTPHVGASRLRDGSGEGSHGGTRHATTVCRGAPSVRRSAQGRVGGHGSPRHVGSHLAPHPLLAAKPSGSPDDVRHFTCDRINPAPRGERAGRDRASPSKAQPGDHSPFRPGTGDTELRQPGGDAVADASALDGPSGGKGVLAA
jgi:hypothetical protein